MQMCMLMKERDKVIKTRTDWCRKKIDFSVFIPKFSSLESPYCVGHRRDHQLVRNWERMTSRSPLDRESHVSMGHTSRMF